ncbi:MAG TPA: long-chain fatty acid--CoA ligase [Nitrososphaerales archaeon]|nr:long-chain fatty acid--CoA ligase [Nitrososphaerales archaeon]
MPYDLGHGLLVQRPWRKAWAKHVVEGADELLEPRPLFELISKTAAASPSRRCLRFQGAGMSYGQVDDLSSRFASVLLALGAKKGDRVALFLPNMPQFIAAYFGTLKAGGIVVPCSPLYKTRELEFQLRDSGSSFLVAANDVVKGNDLFASVEGCRYKLDIKVITASLTDYLPGAKRALAGLAGVKNEKRTKIVGAFRDLVSKSPPLSKNAEIDPRRDVAVLQYTGGTTGVAKGAMLTHSNLYMNAAVTARWFPLKGDDIALGALPFFHIYGMTAAMNAPLSAGGSIVLLPRFEVDTVMKVIQDEKITSFCGVPTMYIAVINHPNVAKFSLRTVRGCISGGAALPRAVSEGFARITGGTLVEGYGLSESSPVTHCNPMGEGAAPRDGSIGVPVPFTDAKVVDMGDSSKELPVGEAGELAVKGPQVMLGYWNNVAETENVFTEDGWLLTGDIAKMDPDGYFYIVDRKKDMIDVSGLKVYPREVEELLFNCPGVKEAAVVGMPDSYRGEAVHAYIVLKPESKGKVSEDDVIRFCRSNLSTYKAPRKVTFVDELPKSLVGKVLRRKLRETDASAEQAPAS